MLNTSLISINIKKKLGERSLEYNLTVPSTGITFLYGPSGSGKTSLINLISGLLEPDSGRITIGDDVFFDSEARINKKIHQRSVGYVFQDARLFPHLNVKQNLYYAKNATPNEKALKLIELLGISTLMTRKIYNLSGGEQQRVSIARALLSNPKVLLLDEPFSSLDQTIKEELIDYFSELVKHLNIPIIMVSHSKNEVFRLANNLVLIDEGRVIEQGRVEQVWNAKTWFTEEMPQSFDLVYSAICIEHHEHYPMSKIELLDPISSKATGCYLWVDKTKETLSINPFRISLYAQNISISLDNKITSSIRNRIPCKIEKYAQLKDSQNIIVTLQSRGNIIFLAKISLWAWNEMQLIKGMDVVAQIN